MIETWEMRVIYVTLHDKHLTDCYKEMYPDRPECWNCPFDVNIDDIYRLEKTDEGKAVIWIPRDDQGGGMSVEVLEDYDELYDLITSKSKYAKRRIEKNENNMSTGKRLLNYCMLLNYKQGFLYPTSNCKD